MKAFVQLALNWLDQPASSAPNTEDVFKNMSSPLAFEKDELHFFHARANRQIRLKNGSIDYKLSRGRRKTIGMSVGPDGLDVRAPRWASIGSIESVLQEKADWILRKLQEMQERHKHMQSTVIQWRDGALIPFMGEPIKLTLDASHLFKDAGGRLEQASNDLEQPRLLKISVAQNASEPQIRDAVQAWLMQQAKQLFIERLDHFAPLLGVQWRKLSLSNASTRWGSATSDGSIRLNWRLVHFKLEVIDYVVVHELSHLRVMDHSPMFWETVRHVVPDYAQRRAQLKDESLPQWV